MNVVDSSGWLEYFADGPNADDFAGPIADRANLIVPVITLYEVFKRSIQQQGEEAARVCVAAMQEGRISSSPKGEQKRVSKKAKT